MFYTQTPNKTLRFGDVITGYISSVPILKEPVPDNKHPEYSIELSMPSYCVLLSPCCSIGDSKLSMAPLEQINKKLLANAYFVEDMTRVNRLVPPDKALPQTEWNGLPDEEKRNRQSKPSQYTWMNYFIYAEHDLLQPKYQLTYKGINYELGCYMIDFRKIFHINCQLVRNESVVDAKLLRSKILQLSVEIREDLRQKMAYYYRRIPREDEVDMEAL